MSISIVLLALFQGFPAHDNSGNSRWPHPEDVSDPAPFSLLQLVADAVLLAPVVRFCTEFETVLD